MTTEKIYFPNLNGLRFIAAFLVIIHHTERVKSRFKFENHWESGTFIDIIGKLGVVLFFVLSGFLITYLLLAEERSFKQIGIRNFYVRRILRIWPLYFLIVLLAFLVLPNMSLFSLPGFGSEAVYDNLIFKLILFTAFFPNLVLALYGAVPYASHTWSIGTEEQYYLVWPLALRYIRKYRIFLMLGIIFCYLFIDLFLVSNYSSFLPYRKVISSFWRTFRIDCMAIGAIYAILLFGKNKLIALLTNEWLFYCVVALTCGLMAYGVTFPYIHCQLYSVMFGIIILTLASNSRIKLSLENKVLNYLGSISYGLYMYHPICIVLAITLSVYLNLKTDWFVYPMTFILTILFAGVSYKYYERYFLKFKSRFSGIISGKKPYVNPGRQAGNI